MDHPNKLRAAAALIGALVPALAAAQSVSSTTPSDPGTLSKTTLTPETVGMLPEGPRPRIRMQSQDMVIPSFVEAGQTIPGRPPSLPPSIPPPTASIPTSDPDARDLKLFEVINNSRQDLTCAFQAPNGPWQPWINIKPGANWQGDSVSPRISFQCRPPVRQLLYSLRNGTRYSLQPDGAGEIRVVEVMASQRPPPEKPSWDR